MFLSIYLRMMEGPCSLEPLTQRHTITSHTIYSLLSKATYNRCLQQGCMVNKWKNHSGIKRINQTNCLKCVDIETSYSKPKVCLITEYHLNYHGSHGTMMSVWPGATLNWMIEHGINSLTPSVHHDTWMDHIGFACCVCLCVCVCICSFLRLHVHGLVCMHRCL